MRAGCGFSCNRWQALTKQCRSLRCAPSPTSPSTQSRPRPSSPRAPSPQSSLCSPAAACLCSENQQVQVQAVWVIGALALHEEANLQLVSAGVLPLLEALKYSTDTEAR